jgi:SAM-dependent methyltransferase|tara:strand:+ start:199 stop:969 length:771 start_codon:yes stop_codon:yes gene_type:complete
MIAKIMKWALASVPRPLLIRLSYIVQWLSPVLFKGDRFVDPIDGRGYSKFFPYGYGQNQRLNALCPGTNSLERHRLLWLYLKDYTDFLTKEQKLLHIAPEQCFYGRFKKMGNLDYTTADLFSPLADLRFDVQNIPLEDNLYDTILCNHVLEHVDDDLKAMSEMCRILKPGGLAIMQVPLDPDYESTDEDITITDPVEREKRFRQYDHVRLYGQDYPARLKAAGFTVTTFDAEQELPAGWFAKYALPKREMLYICTK